MRKSYRVKRERDFNDIFTKGNNVANRRFVVYWLAKEQPHFRVGLSVSKKLGNAVTRNKIKRKIRHVLIEHQEQLVTNDFVVMSRKGVEELNYQEINKFLLHDLNRARQEREGGEIEKES